MNRRGSQWIQPFAIALFVLFLVIALVLLSFNKATLDDERPQLGQDLLDEQANALLISMLRSPTPPGTLADSLIQPHTDDEVAGLITARMPKDIYYEAYVQWPDHTLYVRNYDLRNDVDVIKLVQSYGRGAVGEGTARLPGGIKLKLFITDASFTRAHIEQYGAGVEPKVESQTGKIDIDQEHIDTASTFNKALVSLGDVQQGGP